MSAFNRSLRPAVRAASMISKSPRQTIMRQWTQSCRHVQQQVTIRSAIQVSRFSNSTRSQQASEAYSANAIVESIEEMYNAASDEFQMAAEETEENTIYAADDRAAAKELVDQLTAYYKRVQSDEAMPQEVKEEVKRRAGTRIRELENAMIALEEAANSHD